MELMALEGPLFAVLTPFRADGEVDFDAFKAYLQFLWDAGVRNILANGTTGEFPSLTINERKRILEFCRQTWRGTLINHVSSCCVKDTLELISHTQENGERTKALADAILILPPFYYAGDLEEGVEVFLRECLRTSSLPSFLYHFPFHVQQAISPAMYRRLAADFPMLRGIKDSGGDIERSLAFKAVCPDLQVYVGNDRAASDVLRKGLDGSVTGAGNALPETFVSIYKGFKEGDSDRMATYQQLLDQWAEKRESITSIEPPIVKIGVAARLAAFLPLVRPPFSDLKSAEAKEVAAWISSLSLLK